MTSKSKSCSCRILMLRILTSFLKTFPRNGFIRYSLDAIPPPPHGCGVSELCGWFDKKRRRFKVCAVLKEIQVQFRALQDLVVYKIIIFWDLSTAKLSRLWNVEKWTIEMSERSFGLLYHCLEFHNDLSSIYFRSFTKKIGKITQCLSM